MTCGYVFGARVLAESKVRAAIEQAKKEQAKKEANAKEPEKQAPGPYKETQATSVEGMI